MPELTYITIVLNDRSGLEATVESLDAVYFGSPSIKNINHLIVDGGSSDGVQSYVKDLVRNRAIATQFVSEKDKGIYDAMNKGVRLADGDAVIFLNAGDEIHSQVDPSSVHREIKKIYNVDCGILAFSAIVRFKRRDFMINARNVSFKSPRLPSSHQSMIFKRSVLLDFPFDISYRICGDYDNFSRIYTSGFKMIVVKSVLAVFFAGGTSTNHPFLLWRESTAITGKYYRLNLWQRLVGALRLSVAVGYFWCLVKIFGIKE